MTDHPSGETIEQPVPSDAEIARCLAMLISDRLAVLITLQRDGLFTPAHLRERYVLLHLEQNWLHEKKSIDGT